MVAMKALPRLALRGTSTGWHPRWTTPAHLNKATQEWTISAAMSFNPTKTIPITTKASHHLNLEADAACDSMELQAVAKVTAIAKLRAVLNNNRCTGLASSRWLSRSRRKERAIWMTEIVKTLTMKVMTPCTATGRKTLK